MPITVRCPQCAQELIAPDELLGKIAACPQCNLTFPLTPSIRSSARDPANPATTAGTAATSQGTRTTLAATTVPSNLPPKSSASLSAAATVPPPSPPDPRGSTPPSSRFKVSKPDPRSSSPPAAPVPTPPRPTEPPASGSTLAKTPSSSPPNAKTRASQPARFISANPTEQRINLGADGRLPELVLQEAAVKNDPAATAPKTSNPLLLVAVLTLSFGLSAALLMMETETRKTDSQRLAEVRDELAFHYTQNQRRLEPYQEELRRALQFHNQGKYAEERRCYRRVIDLLHEEHRDDLTGLTGVRRGLVPPSDEHLESLLSQLLSDR